jgi:hypothetical protein
MAMAVAARMGRREPISLHGPRERVQAGGMERGGKRSTDAVTACAGVAGAGRACSSKSGGGRGAGHPHGHPSPNPSPLF